jgi:predicted ribosome quality control (RQC) complex YloA/Tae2 family protein
MACIADELRGTILGGRVQQVLLPNNLSVGLEVYSRRRRHYLLASVHAELGGLFLASDKLRRGVDRETGLLLLLRKYARGATITAIDQPPFERVLRLEFDHPEWGWSVLVVEIMGRHSNIMLVSADGQVLDAVKRVGPHMSSKRPIFPGRPYTPPPPQAKLSPSDLTEYRLRQIVAAHEPDAQVWQVLVKGLRGVSPLLAREVAFRALGHPRARLHQVERLAPLLEAVRELMAPLADGEWQPTVVLEGDRPVVYAPYLLTHRGDPQVVPSLSQAIEAYTAATAGSTVRLGATGSTDPYAAAKHPVREAIGRARARLERRRQALEASLEQAGQADRWRQWGEWILAYSHTIAPGQKQLVAEVGSGEPLNITLDPGKSAVDNAQTYFARYRKAQRAAKGGPARLNEVNLALQDLEQLETDLELASSRPEIDEVRAALAKAGYLTAKKRLAKAAPSRPLSVTSPDGFAILVGRNSRQNDQVTFRRAKGDDWWFHARGVPGAHVIVRSQGRELPPDTVRRAAELAAYFSRLRGESRVAVDYTQRRYVRRVPGAAPGLVTYGQERTVRVAPLGPDRGAQSERHPGVPLRQKEAGQT